MGSIEARKRADVPCSCTRERARTTAKQPTIDEREIVYVEVRGFNYSGILVFKKPGFKKPALEFALISLFFKKLEAGPAPPMFKKKGLACASIMPY